MRPVLEISPTKITVDQDLGAVLSVLNSHIVIMADSGTSRERGCNVIPMAT